MGYEAIVKASANLTRVEQLNLLAYLANLGSASLYSSLAQDDQTTESESPWVTSYFAERACPSL